MKLIQWNCQGSFRTKNERILKFNPDILIICECESPERLKFGELTPWPSDFYWYGDNEHKGIGIFSFSDFKIDILDSFNADFRYVLPFRATKNNYNFTLFAIWAMGHKTDRKARYIGQVWGAINFYQPELFNKSILIGDFNSNQIWDYKDRHGNHTDVVNKLKDRNILSLYHVQNKLEHGKENHPTFFLQRKPEKPYHIDYCFASSNLIKNGFDIAVGKINEWIDLSDHSPLIIDISE